MFAILPDAVGPLERHHLPRREFAKQDRVTRPAALDMQITCDTIV
jgi:hypothetical protein